MAKPVNLPSISFPTQSAALKYFKDILYAYDVGQVISDSTHDMLLWTVPVLVDMWESRQGSLRKGEQYGINSSSFY